MVNDYLFRDIEATQNLIRASTPQEADAPLDEVLTWFKKQTNLEERFGYVFRQSIDEVLDGQRTGRFDINQAEKTEKTYLGTKVEIILRSEFSLPRGERMDNLIAGHETDSKFTSQANWTIPREADGHICLLMKADDHGGRYEVGLLRICDSYLNLGRNRDGKRTPSAIGRRAIRWIVQNGKIPPNTLLNLRESDRRAIFSASEGHRGGGNGGQLRTNELFRRVQGEPVNRNTVLTVASQDDGPKRVRDARIHLRPEGILILGHQGQHPRIARELGLPVPNKGSWIAVHLSKADPGATNRPVTEIDGKIYTVWREGDAHTPAPVA
ncbi:NaeI family type II restriction endonuclease [Streptomyces sp. BYX5S]